MSSRSVTVICIVCIVIFIFIFIFCMVGAILTSRSTIIEVHQPILSGFNYIFMLNTYQAMNHSTKQHFRQVNLEFNRSDPSANSTTLQVLGFWGLPGPNVIRLGFDCTLYRAKFPTCTNRTDF